MFCPKGLWQTIDLGGNLKARIGAIIRHQLIVPGWLTGRDWINLTITKAGADRCLHNAGQVIQGIMQQHHADIGSWRGWPGFTPIAEVDIISDPHIVTGRRDRFDETARLVLDLQPVGLALGQHGLNVMVELPDFFRGMTRQAEEGPQIGFQGMKV